ncbi:hypothetical protein OG883_42690 [Streptomyces sp. NBC_01142]|uniref:hypothetical protein n=1 Tax=Streptomyces sp. NBC_01142 TaxID=2975865 RepID=UPI00225A13D9|nr:hypothetical protein [Streptomyces sp. NBC_01142]MCX4826352.1 hypothetical protein [Streptomyces sp. NBC_01142]
MPATTNRHGDEPPAWHLTLGETIDRAELHHRYGGRIHPRISPSRSTQNVFLFTTPAGLFDGWTGEHVHFTGEGGTAGTDQVLTHGNKSVLHHHAEGRTLRLFHQRPDTMAVTYLGHLHLDSDRPYLWADAPCDPRRPLEIARRLVFRLRPVFSPPPAFLPTAPPAALMPQVRTDSAPRLLPDPSPAQRAEANLLAAYSRYLRAVHATDLVHYGVRPAGALAELFTHHDTARNELVAVRPTLARTAIWAALGELQDLTRFIAPRPDRALLLPSEPDDDLAELLQHADAAGIWPVDRYLFTRTQPPRRAEER